MSDYPECDASVVARLASLPAESLEDQGRDGLVRIGDRVVDLSNFDDYPRRARGVSQFTDTPSLIRFAKDHEAADLLPRVYVDLSAGTMTAVLNSHRVVGDQLMPAWEDHRAGLMLVKTQEWQHWSTANRRWMDQATFAEHIEDHLLDITNPDSATLLELVQELEGTTNVEWQRAERIQSGQRKLVYRETTTAGGSGVLADVPFPARFELTIPVIEGDTDGYKIEARLRFRVQAAGLSLSYSIDRPDAIWRDALDRHVKLVEDGLGLIAYHGEPAPVKS